MAWEYGDLSVEYRHSEGREEIQPKPCKVANPCRVKKTTSLLLCSPSLNKSEKQRANYDSVVTAGNRAAPRHSGTVFGLPSSFRKQEEARRNVSVR